MVERDGFDDEDFNDFLKLKYPKILFTRNKKYICDDSLYFKEYKNQKQLPDIIPNRKMYKKGFFVKKIRENYGQN